MTTENRQALLATTLEAARAVDESLEELTLDIEELVKCLADIVQAVEAQQ